MHRIKLSVVLGMVVAAACLLFGRAYFAISKLVNGDPTTFLAFPLTAILPGLALLFLAARRQMKSQEGAMMQLGAMIQILLILALPNFALHLALGFPVVFLFVELFETRMPSSIKIAVEKKLIT
ncbi:MAG: hypothetical protein ABJ327_04020 [Litoreibacter sp.]